LHSYTCSFVYFGFTGSGVGAEVVLVVVLFAVSLFFYYSASLLRIVSNLYSKFYALLDASNFMLFSRNLSAFSHYFSFIALIAISMHF